MSLPHLHIFLFIPLNIIFLENSFLVTADKDAYLPVLFVSRYGES